MATLKKYQQKRDFKATPEPEGKPTAPGKQALHFVIQRHAASRLHYDFRLEMDGVLKSWAVPKGPSLNPADKRLAMMVEDHPYDYQYFEGSIPKGNYGAGEVEIWDKGTYEALEKQPRKKEETMLLQALKSGSLKFILHGKKLKGEFALVRMKTSKDDNAWLLLKHKDSYAVSTPYDAEAHVKKKSKVTAAVLEKKARKHKPAAPASRAAATARQPAEAGTKKKYSHFIRPMLATLSSQPFTDKDWIFEIKWDGYRAIAETGKNFRFYSRNGLNFSGRYPVIAAALQEQEQDMVIDGEVVAYNDAGLPDFQTLQHYGEHSDVPIVYYAFDLLYLNGHRTEELPLLQRKELLQQALVENDRVRYCDHIATEGVSLFKVIRQKNLEGMIAKRADSSYTEGRRSTAWLKIKHHHTEEVVIAGYTEPRGSRKKFGALILGRYQHGKLVYAGHTGTGFDERSLNALYQQMQPLVVRQSPFEMPPKTNMPAVWVRPKLVCAIKFAELTKEHIFRQPVFQGLREDKAATEVIIPENETAMTDKPVKKKQGPSKTAPPQEKEALIKADGKTVKLSNPQKIYWPREGYTKSDLVNYYNQVAPFILPYLKNRPESLNRFPDGISGESFYQKDAGAIVPDWISTAPIYSESNHKEIDYVVCNNRASMLYLANLGCIELNPWNSTTKKPDHPTYMIMDIDPSEQNTFEQVVEATLVVKQVLDRCGAVSFCKTSGSTGLHVYIPMGNKYSYEQVKNFAHLIAIQVTEQLPGTTTLERNLKKRGNKKIYIDYLQNRKGQTIACAYSVRPRPGATVSTPLNWKEVKPGLDPARFTIKNIHRRLEKTGDLFRPVLGRGIDMLQCIKKLSG